MTAALIGGFRKAYVSDMLMAVSDVFPDILQAMTEHEIGVKALSRDAYLELRRPVLKFLAENYTPQNALYSSVDLFFAIRFELRYRLGVR
jgi:hypothetical protein